MGSCQSSDAVSTKNTKFKQNDSGNIDTNEPINSQSTDITNQNSGVQTNYRAINAAGNSVRSAQDTEQNQNNMIESQSNPTNFKEIEVKELQPDHFNASADADATANNFSPREDNQKGILEVEKFKEDPERDPKQLPERIIIYRNIVFSSENSEANQEESNLSDAVVRGLREKERVNDDDDDFSDDQLSGKANGWYNEENIPGFINGNPDNFKKSRPIQQIIERQNQLINIDASVTPTYSSNSNSEDETNSYEDSFETETDNESDSDNNRPAIFYPSPRVNDFSSSSSSTGNIRIFKKKR